MKVHVLLAHWDDIINVEAVYVDEELAAAHSAEMDSAEKNNPGFMYTSIHTSYIE